MKKEKIDYEMLADCYAKIIDKKNDLLQQSKTHLEALDMLLEDTLDLNERFLIENGTLKNNFYIMVIVATALLIGLIIK